VKELNGDDSNVIRRFFVETKSTTLRFTYIKEMLIVFDATRGPCVASVPGYAVLNLSESFYEPGDDPSRVYTEPPLGAV
jgi:hypothetical protein